MDVLNYFIRPWTVATTCSKTLRNASSLLFSLPGRFGCLTKLPGIPTKEQTTFSSHPGQKFLLHLLAWKQKYYFLAIIIFWPSSEFIIVWLFLFFWFCNEKFCIYFRKRFNVYQKTGLLFKKIKVSTSSNSVELTVFLWDFAHVFSSAMLSKHVKKIVRFLNQ